MCGEGENVIQDIKAARVFQCENKGSVKCGFSTQQSSQHLPDHLMHYLLKLWRFDIVM